MATVFIDGEQGTTGLRIASRLRERADITLLSLPESERKQLPARAEMARKADATVLCLPDEASRELVAALADDEGVILDASTAHRTDPRFTYGFAELSPSQPQRIAQSRRIAVPGCHASGCIALLVPLMAGGVIAPDAKLSFTSLTGYSGGGKKMIAQYEDASRDPALHAPRPYAVTQAHKHLPEIMHVSGLTVAPVFQPIVMDAYSGMLVSLPLHGAGTVEELTALYRDFYHHTALISVLDPNPEASISSIAMADTDAMQIFVTGNDERKLVYARFDNLGKGACGAALQCLNLALGADPLTGLTV